MRRLLLSCWLLLIPLRVFALPLQTAILSPSEEAVGTALIYIDYVELLDPSKQKIGKIAYVMREGLFEMLLVREDEDKSITGRATNRRLYNEAGELVALYDWTSFWVYVYSPNGKRLGKAKCIAFRIGTAADAVSAFDDDNGLALGNQRASRRKASRSSANDHHVWIRGYGLRPGGQGCGGQQAC